MVFKGAYVSSQCVDGEPKSGEKKEGSFSLSSFRYFLFSSILSLDVRDHEEKLSLFMRKRRKLYKNMRKPETE